MFTFGGAGGAHGVDPLILILFAMLIEAYVGEARMVFSRLRHPVAIIGGLVEALDRKLNRETRSAGDRAVRGLGVVLIVGGGAGAVGWAIADCPDDVPWHRVVNVRGVCSTDRVEGAQGREGVEVEGDGA